MPKSIQIGRGKTCGRIKITAGDVSGNHCTITDNGNGTYTVVDNGSTNGTYVDGHRIFSKTVSADTVIQLASNTMVKVADLFAADPSPAPPAPGPIGVVGRNHASVSIRHLMEMRKKHEAEVERLKSNQEKMMALRIGLPSLGAIATGLSASQSGMSNITILVTIITLVITLISVISSPRKKIEELQKKFKKDYSCPACGWPLAAFDERQLELMGACPNSKCKVKYVI